MRHRYLLSLLLMISGDNLYGSVPAFVLGPGDNLPYAVGLAQHGDVIELRSNGSYAGNLSWGDKHLTIQAGDGFTPTIQGSLTGIVGNAQTGGTFHGLNFTGGLSASTTSTRMAAYHFEDTTFGGLVSVGGTGRFHVDVSAQRSSFLGGVRFGGTGDMSIDAVFNDNVFAGQTYFTPIGNVHYDLKFFENEFLSRPIAAGVGNLVDLDFERNLFHHGAEIVVDSYDTVDLKMANNLLGNFSSPDVVSGPGLLVRSIYDHVYFADVDIALVNNTIVGFETGLEVRGFNKINNWPTGVRLVFANLLLSNQDDLLNVTLSDISYSLIADGTFNGQNSNFSGTPLLGPAGQLRYGSSGIDRGNNARAGALDYIGNSRIVDGNGDSLAIVDVGAYEFVIPEPSSIVLILFSVFISIGRYAAR